MPTRQATPLQARFVQRTENCGGVAELYYCLTGVCYVLAGHSRLPWKQFQTRNPVDFLDTISFKLTADNSSPKLRPGSPVRCRQIYFQRSWYLNLCDSADVQGTLAPYRPPMLVRRAA